MNNIITKIHNLIKDTDDLIAFEEQVKILMHETFADLVGETFTHLNKVMKERARKENYYVEQDDPRTIEFSFGSVTYNRTLFKDSNQNKSIYLLDKWLGFHKHHRYSPLVELKVAKLASESTYRESARTLNEWTAVSISHTTVGNIIKRVGETQGEADKTLVDELEIAASLPEGKVIDFLYAEADDVYVRGTDKKKHHEIYHGIIYEG